MAPLSGYIIRMWRRALRLVYGFDKWHISSLDQRQYAKDIIRHCNSREISNTFAEIGCGLGDILLNVKFKSKTGFDSDAKVLKAAAFLAGLRKQKVHFEVFSFPATALTGTFDVIAMVNWIHHIEPNTLKAKIEDYYRNNLNHGGEILIDTVQDKEYEYNHDINFLIKELNCPLDRLGEYARQREVWAIKKMK